LSILLSESKLKWTADKLVQIAEFCGFDGWLVNIECELQASTTVNWQSSVIIVAIDSLRACEEQVHCFQPLFKSNTSEAPCVHDIMSQLYFNFMADEN
jgi:Glycosyl hydrolase family 85